MAKLGVNREDQKRRNRGMVLRLVATGQCASRVELSRRMGLSKMAISQIVNELQEKGALTETVPVPGREKGEPGRIPMGIGISPDMPGFIGVLVQRGYCEAILCDLQLRVLRHERIDREWQSREELTEDLFCMTDRLMEEGVPVAGIGAASIGPVKVGEGIIAKPLFFNGIGDIHIRDMMQERYKIPTFFDHDNQSAVLAEYLYGNGRGYSDILLVSVGRGVGCGILTDGLRMHSSTGYAPEIGHLSIDRHGIPCICGNTGCLECYINQNRILERFRREVGGHSSYEAYCRKKDEQSVAILSELAADLTEALVNALNILNSQIVILCADCCCWPEWMLRRIEDDINSRKFGFGEERIVVRKPRFLRETQVLGAACNAIVKVFEGELYVQ